MPTESWRRWPRPSRGSERSFATTEGLKQSRPDCFVANAPRNDAKVASASARNRKHDSSQRQQRLSSLRAKQSIKEALINSVRPELVEGRTAQDDSSGPPFMIRQARHERRKLIRASLILRHRHGRLCAKPTCLLSVPKFRNRGPIL